MHFPIHRAEIVEIIDENTCEVLVTDIGLMRATRSSKVIRAVPELKVGDIVAVQFSPHDQTRCRITYHQFH